MARAAARRARSSSAACRRSRARIANSRAPSSSTASSSVVGWRRWIPPTCSGWRSCAVRRMHISAATPSVVRSTSSRAIRVTSSRARSRLARPRTAASTCVARSRVRWSRASWRVGCPRCPIARARSTRRATVVTWVSRPPSPSRARCMPRPRKTGTFACGRTCSATTTAPWTTRSSAAPPMARSVPAARSARPTRPASR